MKKWIIAFLVSFQLQAALSPTCQSLVEVKKILASEEFLNTFGSIDHISSCEKVEKGYLIKSETEQMFVEVVYEPSKKIGPQVFHLKFHELKPLY